MIECTIKPLKKEKWYSRQYYELMESYEIVGHTVPKGLKSDGATVPIWFTLLGIIIVLVSCRCHFMLGVCIGVLAVFMPVIFPPVGRYLYAAFLHDKLYYKGNRMKADRVFLKALKASEVVLLRRWAMYLAVSIYSFVLFILRR